MSLPNTFAITSTDFSSNVNISTSTTSGLLSATSGNTAAAHYACYVNNYTNTPIQSSNYCLNSFISKNIPYGSGTNSLATSTSWGPYKNIFPNGFVLLSLEEASAAVANIAFTVYNNTGSTYNFTNTNINALLMYNTLPASFYFNATFTVYNQSNVQISQSTLTPISTVKYVSLSGVNAMIPSGGYITFNIKHTQSQQLSPYLLISLTGLTYVTPTINFSNPSSVTTDYEGQTNLVTPINVQLSTDITMDAVAGSVAFTIKKTGSLTSLPVINAPVANNSATLSLTNKIDAGTYEISAAYTSSSANYTNVAATQKTTLVIGKTTLSITSVLSDLSNSSGLYKYNDNLRIVTTVTDTNLVPGSISIAGGALTKTISNTISNVYTFNFKASDYSLLGTVPITINFTPTSSINYTSPSASLSLVIEPIQMVLTALNSSYTYESIISLETYPSSDAVIGDHSLTSLLTGSVNFIVADNNGTIVLTKPATLASDLQTYVASIDIHTIPEFLIQSYNIYSSISNAMTITNPVTIVAGVSVTIANSETQTFSILKQPTSLSVDISEYQAYHDLPFTITGTLTGANYEGVTGTYSLSTGGNPVDPMTYTVTTTQNKYSILVSSPENIGAAINTTVDYVVTWTNSNGDFNNASTSPITVHSIPNTVVTTFSYSDTGSETIESTFTLTGTAITSSKTIDNVYQTGQYQLFFNGTNIGAFQNTFSFNPLTYNVSVGTFAFYTVYTVGSYDNSGNFTPITGYNTYTSSLLNITFVVANTNITSFTLNNSTTNEILSSVDVYQNIIASVSYRTALNKVVPGTVIFNINLNTLNPSWMPFLNSYTYTDDANGNVTTPIFNFLSNNINIGVVQITAQFTPTDLTRYNSSSKTVTYNLSNSTAYISYAQLSMTNSSPTFMESMSFTVQILPFPGVIQPLQGNLVVKCNSITLGNFGISLSADNNTSTLNLGSPHQFGLNVSNTPYHFIFTFTTTKGTIYESYGPITQTLDVNVLIQQVDFELTATSSVVYGNKFYVYVLSSVNLQNYYQYVLINGTVNILINGQQVGTGVAVNSPRQSIECTFVGTTLDISSYNTYSVTATFSSTDPNYSSTLSNISNADVAVSYAPVTLASLTLDGISQSISSDYVLNNINKFLNDRLIINGNLASTTTVNSGSILIQTTYDADNTVVYTTIPVDTNGNFNATVNINSTGIYNTGFFYFYYLNTNDFASADLSYSSNVPGSYYLQIETLGYSISMTQTTNGYVDYMDSVLTCTTTLNVAISADNQTYAQANDEGHIVFNIFDSTSTNVLKTYVVTNNHLTISSHSTTGIWTFNPLNLGLPVGTYLLRSYFSGIDAQYASQDATNNGSNYISFTVTQTNPAINFNASIAPQGTPVSSSIYLQQPYLNLKVESPATITNPYVSTSDIQGQATITVTGSNGVVDLILINGYDSNNANGSVVGTVITNIMNIKTTQLPILTADSYTIQCDFVPEDTVNYTNSTFSINLAVNPYAPVIDTDSIQVLTQIPPASNLLYPGTSLASGLITYDDSFTITNTIKHYDNGNIDYSGIAGTMTYSYLPLTSSSVYLGNGDIYVDQYFFGQSSGTTIFYNNLQYSFVLNLPPNNTVSFADYVGLPMDVFGLPSTPTYYPPGSIINFNVNRQNYNFVTKNVFIMTITVNSVVCARIAFMTGDCDPHHNVPPVGHVFIAGYIVPLTADMIQVYQGKPATIQTLSVGNELASLVSTSDDLSWTATVNPSVIHQSNNKNYELKLQYVPNDLVNYSKSAIVTVPFSIAVANALGSLAISIPTSTVSYLTNSLFEIDSTVSFVPTVNVKTGTISFYRDSDSGTLISTTNLPAPGTVPGYLNGNFLRPAYMPYYIYATLTDTSSDYPVIVQNTPQMLQVNPTLTLSNVSDFQYNTSVTFTANIVTDLEPFNGGSAIFTFTNATSTFTATCAFVNDVATITSSTITDSNNILLMTDLVLGNYTVSCAASFSGVYKNVSSNTVSFNVSQLQVPFTVSIDQNNIYYKNTAPTLTATFNSSVYGGYIVYYIFYASTGLIYKTYTDTHTDTITDQHTTYNFQLPDDLPVGNYNINAGFTNTNYGSYSNTNSNVRIGLVVNKNQLIINPMNAYYVFNGPFSLSVSVTLPNETSLSTITGDHIIFVINNKSYMANTSGNGIFVSPTIPVYGSEGLQAGTYEVYAYYNIGVYFNSSSFVYTNVIITKPELTNSTLLSVSHPHVAGETYYVLIVNSVVGDTINVFTEFSNLPIVTFPCVGFNVYVLDDSFLQTGSNNVYVTVTNVNYKVISNTVVLVKDPVNITEISLSAPTSVVYDTSVTISATVTNERSIVITEGQLAFYVNGAPVGFSALTNNSASITLTMYDMGNVVVTANFVSGLNVNGNSIVGTKTIVVTKATPVVSISKTTSNSNIGETLQLLVNVAQDSTLNSGYVTVYNNGAVFYDNIPVAAGSAAFSLLLEQTSYVLTAVYNGNMNYNASAVSNSLTLTNTIDLIDNVYSNFLYSFSTTNNIMTVTSNFNTPLSNLLSNSGYVAFNLNGLIVNAYIMNGTARVSYVSTSSSDYPSAQYFNDQYSGFLNGTKQ